MNACKDNKEWNAHELCKNIIAHGWTCNSYEGGRNTPESDYSTQGDFIYNATSGMLNFWIFKHYF